MVAIKFPVQLRLECLLLIAAFSATAQGPKIYSAAMSMDYNPLAWQGDDAQFGLDLLHSSHCAAEVSKTVTTKTQNPLVQNLAFTIARDQGKVYRQLRGMARTLNIHLPSKRELDDCPAKSRIDELTGDEMDLGYLALLAKTTSLNTSQFEMEVTRPRLPSNWSLWKLAQTDLPMVRNEEAAVKSTLRQIGDSR